MPTAQNDDVELYYETFGSSGDPTLLLVNGLGSQCINYAEAWCEKFAAEGYQVVRFDNRDTGLSSKLDGVQYTVADMALDCVAVLDAIGVERAHVMGLSMGGMIVQRLAIDHRRPAVDDDVGDVPHRRGRVRPERTGGARRPHGAARDLA